MPGKFCYTCIHWERVNSDNDSSGLCHDVTVALSISIEEDGGDGEDGKIWTNGYFGCIYWRENDGSLLSTDEIGKDML